MTNSPIKTLANMPDAIRMSAWCNRRHQSTFANLVCNAEEKLVFVSGALAYFAWWTAAYWLFVWVFEMYSLEKSFQTFERIAVIGFLATFALNLLAHWIGVQTTIPRAERGWPALSDSVATDVFRWLAAPCLVFAGLMFASVKMKSHGAVTGFEHLPAALESLVIGLLAALLYARPLRYGNVLPSNAEADKDAVRRHAEAQKAMQSRDRTDLGQTEDYATPIQPRKARITFADIDGMQAVKDKLLAPARSILAEREPSAAEDPQNGVLLHGEPGNGKTTFGEGLAGELGVPFLELTYGGVASKWVGETPRVIANCFALAKRSAPCVFFIDELDSFIPRRDAVSNNSEEAKITNTILTELVGIRRHRVVVVGATNFLSKLDPAAVREGRFDFKVEVGPPDEPARVGILRKAAAKFANTSQVDDAELVSIATRWNGFSVARLQGVAKALPAYLKSRARSEIHFDDWIGALREVQGQSRNTPAHAKDLSELVLDASTREALELIAARLKDSYRVESLGGTLPNGVLFSGPSGTGKTEAARALAKESGWAFISTAGPDMISDREKLDKVFADAKDRRPALIFIDEADDLLRSRQFSATSHITNKLLALMDGAGEKVKDIVVIAATNHPDDVDSALLRAGRFTEKVTFAPPQSHEVPRFIATWLKAKGISLESGFDVFDAASMFEGETIANIQGALQYALNKAIHVHSGASHLNLRRVDIEAALAVVARGDGAGE